MFFTYPFPTVVGTTFPDATGKVLLNEKFDALGIRVIKFKNDQVLFIIDLGTVIG